MEKALNIISNHIEKILSAEGFSRQKGKNPKEVIFRGKDIAYSIIFEDSNNSFKFRSCGVNDSELDMEWKILSEWLFEPGVSTQKDAEMIALDFSEAITGIQKKQTVKPHKKKKELNKVVDLSFFINRLISFFPDLKEDFKYEKENYENFRYVYFVENKVVPKVNFLLKDSFQKDRIKKLAVLLNNMYSSGDLDVRGIVTTVILRNIDDTNGRAAMEGFMDEELKKAWKASDALKGKKIKPEKKKAKKKKSFIADTLQR